MRVGEEEERAGEEGSDGWEESEGWGGGSEGWGGGRQQTFVLSLGSLGLGKRGVFRITRSGLLFCSLKLKGYQTIPSRALLLL